MIELLTQIISGMSGKVLSVTLQILLTTAVALYLKDLAERVVNFLKMKFSDFGRGTKIEFNGKIGYITRVTLGNVEIRLDDESVMIVPISRFLMMPKIIYTKIPERNDEDL